MQPIPEAPDLFSALQTHEAAYPPRPAPRFQPQRIILTKGSVSTRQRRVFVESICSVYPRAEIIEQLETPHN